MTEGGVVTMPLPSLRTRTCVTIASIVFVPVLSLVKRPCVPSGPTRMSQAVPKLVEPSTM